MILVTGGTGFVGRHLIQRMRQEGLRVRALVRDPRKASWLEQQGVELVPGDVNDPASLKRAMARVERVVHLVGIIQELPDVTFERIHVEGTENVVDASRRASVRSFLYMSALGTRPNAKSAYHKTKWEAEEIVRASSVPFTILRPSLIYGKGDGFTSKLSEAISLSPFLPIIGSGKSKVQPIFIEDVVSCAVKALSGDTFLNKSFEIGGPRQLTYEEVTISIAEAMGIRRRPFHAPVFFMKAAAELLGGIMTAPPITADQIRMLQEDNICDMRDIREIFDVEPLPFKEGLARFIQRKK